MYNERVTNNNSGEKKMSVHAKRVVRGVGVEKSAVLASEILKSDHPLHKAFSAWLGNKQATRRKAREFLSLYPQYREVQSS